MTDEQATAPPRKPATLPVNATKAMTVAWLPGRVSYPAHTLSIIVKGSFALRPGGPAEPLDGEPFDLAGDEYEEDEGKPCLVYATDFAYFKPRTDLLVKASCHAPGGEAVEACRVRLRIGGQEQAWHVFGDRFWTKDQGGGVIATKPNPFVTLPLRHSRSFGGTEVADNPLGKGAGIVSDEAGRRFWPLPNVELPGQRVSAPESRPLPAAVGPLEMIWPQRVAKSGSYGDDWLKTRWPWFPEDFDWGFFNAAPEALQAPDYLRGDEAFQFENLHSEYPVFEGSLPGRRVRCFLSEFTEETGDERRLREVPLRLDTLYADLESEHLVLVWRGVAEVQSDEFAEVEHVFVFDEPLAEPASSDADVQALYLRCCPGRVLAVEAEPEPEPPLDLEAELAEADAEIAQGLLAAGLDPDKVLGDPSHQELIERARGVYRRALIDSGQDAAPADSWVPPADELPAEIEAEFADMEPLPAEPLTRDDCLARIAQDGNFVEEDLSGLDLSGLDFSGRDLSGANLTGAKLAGCGLQKARLCGAGLGGADLSGADLSGADLSDADLAGAELGQANLTEASLDAADLTGAKLVASILINASAVGARLLRADLGRADLRGCDLKQANLTESSLAGTDARQASFAQATLEGVSGPGVDLRGAILTSANLSEGSRFPKGRFRHISADDSSWESAELQGADFAGAHLKMADFSRARMKGASLACADMPMADFARASLEGALLIDANLFQGSLEKADLTRADLSGANLYEVDLREAKLNDAQLARANLGRTLLEEPR